MAKGGRRGGRAVGTPNKRTLEVCELIETTLGASPLEKMARLAKELLDGDRVLLIPRLVRDGDGARMETEESDAKAIEIASKLLSELAQYCAPKRKAIEHTGPDGSPLDPIVRVFIPNNQRSDRADG